MDLSYLPEALNEGHMPPTDEVISLWRKLRESLKYNHLFEIGLNAGHSSAINLELFDDVKITSLDIGRHRYTQIAADRLKEKFNERFDYIECHSMAYFNRIKDKTYDTPKNIDAIFVDGGHDPLSVMNDISMGKWLGVKDIFIDDTNSLNVSKICELLESMDIMYRINSYRYKCETKSDFIENEVSHYRFL